jgi:DNA-binding transcriptional LysR family regulator
MDRVSSMLSFVKVVEHGGFSAAARQLNMATSAVTTHVKLLEERLQVRLLNRTTRNVSLTEVGRAYYERCVQILSEIEDAEDTVQSLQLKPRGILRVNTSPAVPMVIAPSIAEYNGLYPDVTVHLTTTSRMLDLVEQGFDLAIWYAGAPDLSLIRRHLASYRSILCASPDYLAKHGHPQHPTDLAKHKCIVYYDAPFGKGGREWTFTGPGGETKVEVFGPLEANSVDAIRAAAVGGQGFVYAPTHLVLEELKSGALVPVLRDFLGREVSVDALYPNREHLPAKVRTFIDLVAKNFRQIDWDPCAQAGKSSGQPKGEAMLRTEVEVQSDNQPALLVDAGGRRQGRR